MANTTGSTRHRLDVVDGENVRGRHPDEHVGATHGIGEDALTQFAIGVLGEPLPPTVELFSAVPHHTVDVDADDVAHSGTQKHLADRHARRTDRR